MNVNWIITAFVIVDTTFTTLEHQSDVRAGVPDSEIITVALVAAKYFANNHKLTLSVMQQLHYLSGTISHSRFNRRLQLVRCATGWSFFLNISAKYSAKISFILLTVCQCRFVIVPVRNAVQKYVVNTSVGGVQPSKSAILDGNST